MSYRYEISENLIVNIYDAETGELVDFPGPYATIESATQSADMIVAALNSGEISDPRIKGDE